MTSRPPWIPDGCDVIASLPVLGISGWRLAVGGWEHILAPRAARGAAPTSRQALPRYSILNTPYSDFTFAPLHRPQADLHFCT
jgi:hypothetical protein